MPKKSKVSLYTFLLKKKLTANEQLDLALAIVHLVRNALEEKQYHLLARLSPSSFIMGKNNQISFAQKKEACSDGAEESKSRDPEQKAQILSAIEGLRRILFLPTEIMINSLNHTREENTHIYTHTLKDKENSFLPLKPGPICLPFVLSDKDLMEHGNLKEALTKSFTKEEKLLDLEINLIKAKHKIDIPADINREKFVNHYQYICDLGLEAHIPIIKSFTEKTDLEVFDGKHDLLKRFKKLNLISPEHLVLISSPLTSQKANKILLITSLLNHLTESSISNYHLEKQVFAEYIKNALENKNANLEKLLWATARVITHHDSIFKLRSLSIKTKSYQRAKTDLTAAFAYFGIEKKTWKTALKSSNPQVNKKPVPTYSELRQLLHQDQLRTELGNSEDYRLPENPE